MDLDRIATLRGVVETQIIELVYLAKDACEERHVVVIEAASLLTLAVDHLRHLETGLATGPHSGGPKPHLRTCDHATAFAGR